MAVTTATDARRIGGVPISLKWLSFYVLNPDKDGREVGDWVRATVLLPTVRS